MIKTKHEIILFLKFMLISFLFKNTKGDNKFFQQQRHMCSKESLIHENVLSDK